MAITVARAMTLGSACQVIVEWSSDEATLMAMASSFFTGDSTMGLIVINGG